jgi:4'-phosphopantetheinyl transferase
MSGEIVLNCFFKADIEWSEANAPVDLNIVNIWRAYLPSFFSYSNELISYLDAEELEKSRRYHFDKDSKRYTISRAFLKLLLAPVIDVEARDISIIAGPNKKPVIRDAPNPVSFNISHSGDWLLMAMSSHDIGVDIEKIDRELHYQDIMDQSFSEKEKEFVLRSSDPQQNFFRLWTRKEAISKASSKGITDDYRRTICIDGENRMSSEVIGSMQDWILMTFPVDEHYTGSIAYTPGHATLFRELSYPF